MKQMDNSKLIKLLIVFLVLCIGIIYTTEGTKKSQDTRRSAAENVEVISCGSSNGLSVLTRPIEGLCKNGSPIWTDSVAEDDSFNWFCVDNNDVKKAECSANLQ